jgi:ubiquitin carboxyl-terminal hydrolase 22/27/51
VVQGASTATTEKKMSKSNAYNAVDEDSSCPKILYDLFGTVNHTGSLNQGHYVSNVKVDEQWYHCNDDFICKAGDGDGEKAVLDSTGAYMLFYIRQ